MYITTLFESFHGNRGSFISLSFEDIKGQLIEHLANWDVEILEEEITTVLEKHYGFVNQQSKADVEVRIIKVEPGEMFET